MSVMIGIDPHEGSHAAVVVDEGEEVLDELEVRATRRQTTELLGWAGRFPTRRWAIESANGHGYLLAQQLVAVGEQVVDVPSTLSARIATWVLVGALGRIRTCDARFRKSL